MDLEGEDVHLAPVVDRVRALQEIRARINRAEVHWPPGQTSSSIAEMVSRHPTYPIALKQSVSLLVEAGNTDHFQLLQGTLGPLAIILGDRLLDAISSGEVPSLADVRTLIELHRIIELAESRSHAITFIIIATEGLGQPLSDEIIRRMLRLEPSTTEEIIRVAATLVARGQWASMRRLVLLVIRQAVTPIPIEPFVIVFKAFISQNLMAEGVELITEAGMTERWAPLYEAQRAVVSGSRAQLDSLAPEMRIAALGLYDQLCSLPKPSDEAHDRAGDMASKPPPEKRKATKRRPTPTLAPEQAKRSLRRKPARRGSS